MISYDGEGRPQRMVGINIDVTERKQSEEHQAKLVAELDHRVKNVLATVAAVANHTSEHNGALADFDRRIQSMADAHGLLSRSQWQGVSLAELVSHELAPYATAENTIVDGPDVGTQRRSDADNGHGAAELATNAAKYGALSTPLGSVSVHWDLQSNGNGPAQLKLQWRENGGPVVTTPGRSSYGTNLIRELVPYELGGTVDLEFKPDGVHCTIAFGVE